MSKIAGVKFKTAGKIYDFKSDAFVLNPGDRVIVETEQGLGFGKIAIPPVEVENVQKKLKQIVRVATKDDFIRREEIKRLEKEGYQFDVADGTFQIMVEKLSEQFTPLFDLDSFRVTIEKNKDQPCYSHATIKISVDGEVQDGALKLGRVSLGG